MKKKVFFILGAVFLFSIHLKAQMPQVKEAVIDKNAQEIMKRVAQKMSGYKSLQLDFTTDQKNSTDKKASSHKGTLLIQGDKYRIKLDKQIIYCDGKTIWYYQPEEREVQIHDFDPKNVEAINLTKLLAEYDKNYRPRLIREEKNGNTFLQIVDLIPVKSLDYYKLRLSVNKELSQISQMEVFFREGNTITYKIDNYKPNVTILTSDFMFDVSSNPSVEVIDMR